MHILFVSISFPAPGYTYRSSFLGEQVRLLCESELVERITVLSPTPFLPSFMRRMGRVAAQASLPERYEMVKGRCEVLFPRYFKAPGNMFLRWTTAQWRCIVDQVVARFARTYPVSIIHANSGSVSSWAAVHVAKKYGIPSVVAYQGSEVYEVLADRAKGWHLCQESFRYADLNLPVSRSLEKILKDHAQPTGRCEILVRGVDLTRFFPSPELTADPHVLFVGRIEKAKGVFDLLAAWTKVKSTCPNALLIMVGPDCTEGFFRRQVCAYGLEDTVRLVGPRASHEVAELMRQSRVLCLPSHGEGTPNCVMEALACGLPVVATQVGGIPDIVVHERTGLLVERGKVQELAAALISLLCDPARCVRMGQVANVFAREHLDARKRVSHLIGLYGELISSGPTSSLSS